MIKNNLIKLKGLKFQLRHLLYGEYFTDAVRNTITIILPVALLFYYNQQQAAIGTGVGALLISLTDLPGNRRDKFNSALSSTILFFITALIICFSLPHHWLMAITIFVLVFAFAMCSIFGQRKGLTGLMATILAIFILGIKPHDPLWFSLYVLLGSVWYYMISLIQINIWPYRSLHHAIFECLFSTAAFLKAKAKCYDPEAPLEACYKETIALHIKVNEKQELIRTLLLSDKSAMKPTNARGRQFLSVAQHVIDLYEQVTAVHYDYELIRKALEQTGALALIIDIIDLLAEELKILSGSFLSAHTPKDQSLLAKIAQKQDALIKTATLQQANHADVLFKVIKNINDIITHIDEIRHTEKTPAQPVSPEYFAIGYDQFLSPTLLNSTPLKAHFSIKSPALRFSLRLAVLCLTAFITTLFFPDEKYSYWMLLTIVIVARPRYGLTLKRNIERLSGTLTGVVMGLLLILIIKPISILLILAGIFLAGFFAFNRVKYAISVFCITAMVVIALHVYQGHVDHIISERLYYTLIGCAMTFAATYLFPVWETGQLKNLISDVITTNKLYLETVGMEIWAEKADLTNAKLARKATYLKLAKFSEALRYMQVEPHIKRIDVEGVHLIETLSYRINAIIASMSLSAKKLTENKNNAVIIGDILNNLRYCIENEDDLNLQTITREKYDNTNYPEADNGFTNQVELLKSLSAELKGYFSV